MSTSTLLELFGGFMVACVALWFVAMNRFVAIDIPASKSAPRLGSRQ